jgi:hypothetical protein
LNGGGGSIAYYFTKLIGIEGEFEGYGSYTHNFTVPPPYCNGRCAVSAQGNLFTYNVGPIVKFRLSHFEPFVETLFGGAHSNFYGNLYTACTGSGCLIASKSPSNNAFDFLIGGGIDIPVNEHIAIRPAQFEYLLTRFGNDFTKGNMVLFYDINVSNNYFPSLPPASTAQMDQLFRTFVPPYVNISLDRVVAYLPKLQSVTC